MQITFDPHSAADCATIARLLGTAAPAPTQPDTAPAHAQSDTPAQPDTPAQSDTAQSDPTATDCHGMTHDDAIHSTPASKNADGSWRARRGAKDAYEAAIAAATAPAPVTMPVGMPTPKPAAPAPATPPAPISYKDMANRFMAKMADPAGLPVDYETIYTALSIGYDDLETNQTSIARLWNYMEALDDGQDHAGCVRHAMGA